MAKAKSKSAKKPSRKIDKQRDTPVDVGDWDAPEFEAEFKGSALSWEDRQLLGNVLRFLYTVVNPRLLRRALRAGYSKSEHRILRRVVPVESVDKFLKTFFLELVQQPLGRMRGRWRPCAAARQSTIVR
ncbi:MAG: hypothetical protein U0271_11310 [Polyangiaceae bacterium]